jgi:DNA-binding MarR family transcriptional regulator
MSRKAPIPVAAQTDIADQLEPELGGLETIAGFHLRLANNAVFRHFMNALAPLDLTQKQTSVLWLIAERPGIAQIDLAARLDMDRATMMAIIDRLEARDLVARTRSTGDRRRQDLHLTAAGKDLFFHHALIAVRAHEEWLKNRIGDDAAVRGFVETLKRIYG